MALYKSFCMLCSVMSLLVLMPHLLVNSGTVVSNVGFNLCPTCVFESGAGTVLSDQLTGAQLSRGANSAWFAVQRCHRAVTTRSVSVYRLYILTAYGGVNNTQASRPGVSKLRTEASRSWTEPQGHVLGPQGHGLSPKVMDWKL